MRDKLPFPHKGIDISKAKFSGDIPRLIHHAQVNPWIPLHEYGPKHSGNWVESSARRWFLEWSKTIPSTGCSCESHWAELIQETPPDYSSAKAFFEWSWKAHDTVSERHSKRPRISLQEAYAIYWRES